MIREVDRASPRSPLSWMLERVEDAQYEANSLHALIQAITKKDKRALRQVQIVKEYIRLLREEIAAELRKEVAGEVRWAGVRIGEISEGSLVDDIIPVTY